MSISSCPKPVEIPTLESMKSDERWKETRDLLKQALNDWEKSHSLAVETASTTREQELEEKERLEKLLHRLKEKIDELR